MSISIITIQSIFYLDDTQGLHDFRLKIFDKIYLPLQKKIKPCFK